MAGFMGMSLQQTVIDYLTAVRSDAADPTRVDRLIRLVESHKKTHLEETQAYSKIIAGFINLLFLCMPEIKEADPQLVKVGPVYKYCLKLPKSKRTPKGLRSSYKHSR
jgi:hypothetical protein